MSETRAEDFIKDKGRPFTGAEFLESLRDGREVYIYGDRVADVTTHPAFRNAARVIAPYSFRIAGTRLEVTAVVIGSLAVRAPRYPSTRSVMVPRPVVYASFTPS